MYEYLIYSIISQITECTFGFSYIEITKQPTLLKVVVIFIRTYV